MLGITLVSFLCQGDDVGHELAEVKHYLSLAALEMHRLGDPNTTQLTRLVEWWTFSFDPDGTEPDIALWGKEYAIRFEGHVVGVDAWLVRKVLLKKANMRMTLLKMYMISSVVKLSPFYACNVSISCSVKFRYSM